MEKYIKEQIKFQRRSFAVFLTGILLIALTVVVVCCGFVSSNKIYPVDYTYYEDFKNLLKTESTAFIGLSEEQYKELYEDWYRNYAFSDILVSEDRTDLELIQDDISIYDTTYPSRDTLSDGVYYLYNGDEAKDATVVVSTNEDIVKFIYTARYIDGTLMQYIVDDLKYDNSGWYISQSENISLKWDKEDQSLFIEDQNHYEEYPQVYMTGDYALVIPY